MLFCGFFVGWLTSSDVVVVQQHFYYTSVSSSYHLHIGIIHCIIVTVVRGGGVGVVLVVWIDRLIEMLVVVASQIVS